MNEGWGRRAHGREASGELGIEERHRRGQPARRRQRRKQRELIL